MAMIMSDSSYATTFHKGLSEWWSEETEYVFQRIERWAAFARGYNRLRSRRLSKGRMTMHEEQDANWTISSNKLIIDDQSWNPRFHTLKRTRRRSRAEEDTKINCCSGGTIDYRSNGNLDSTCLETYRYDHSIYFKTIGEIRSSKKEAKVRRRDQEEKEREDEDDGEEVELGLEEEEERKNESSFEQAESSDWEAARSSVFDSSVDRSELEDDVATTRTTVTDDPRDSFEFVLRDLDAEENEVERVVWPIIDLAKLDLNLGNGSITNASQPVNDDGWAFLKRSTEINNNVSTKNVESLIDSRNGTRDNANVSQRTEELSSSFTKCRPNYEEAQRDQESVKRFSSFKKNGQRVSKKIKQPAIVGDNNVVWPSVLLNYTRNVNYASPASPHHHRIMAVGQGK